MTGLKRPRFNVEALRRRAGDTTYARGDAYHRGAKVRLLVVDSKRVIARVAGTEDYAVELIGRGNNIAGECSCPAFDDQDFCKHMVAVALAANSTTAEEDTAFVPLRNYLLGQKPDALIELILEAAERDSVLLRKLELASARAADPKHLRLVLRTAIDDATRIRDFVDYSEAGGWATSVSEALEALGEFASGEHAKVIAELAEHAIDRIEQAVENIDDSDGHCSELLERARAIHIAAVRTARPDPVRLARDLFAREMEDEYGTFASAVTLYADALGEEGLAEYRRLATAAWKKLPQRGRGDGFDVDGNYRRLADALDFFAERDGDIEARIALRAKDLSSPWGYLKLAEFCLAQGRPDEALRHGEEGLWVFEDDRPDERLVIFVVELLAKGGRKAEAEAHLVRAFEKAPSLELYKRLRRLSGKSARDRARPLLEARLMREEGRTRHDTSDILIRILIEEKLFDDAWAALRRYGGSAALKENVARASECTHPKEALEIYASRVDQLAQASGNRAYAEAAALIAHMGRLRGVSEQAAYVAELEQRFGRKRNFMKLLV